MGANSQKHPPALPHWVLRRVDQAGVAGLVLAGLAATVGWWIWHGGWGGRLVEVDRAEPRAARFEVDLNAAGWPELAQLPGIGETLARRIVRSRQEDGPYVDPEDLTRVEGIGSKTVETIRPYLRPLPGRGTAAGQQTSE